MTTQKRRNKRKELIALTVAVIATIGMFITFMLWIVAMLTSNHVLGNIVIILSIVEVILDVIAIRNITLD